MSNVLDFKSRSKAESGSALKNLPGHFREELPGSGAEHGSIVDISEKRAEIIQEDRRQVKRTILTEFISVHAIIPNYGLLKVQLYDINDKGLSFDLDEKRGQYNIGEEVELRVYLNHKTYFKIDAKVAHVTILAEEQQIRHGCHFVKNSVNGEALTHFINFLESVTASLRRDGGDILVSKINS